MKEAAFQRRLKLVEELQLKFENAICSARESVRALQQEKEIVKRERAALAREKSQLGTEVERVTQDLLKKHRFEMDALQRRHAEIVAQHGRNRSKDAKRIAELEEELSKLKLAKPD